MVTTDLAPRIPHTAAVRAVLRPYLYGYAAIWAGLILTACLLAVLHPLRHALQSVIPLNYQAAPHRQHPADAATFLSILVANTRVTALPILVTLFVGAKPGWLRRAGDLLITVVLVANLLPIAVEFGTWGLRVLPYIPHAPFELAAFSAGPVTWRIGSRRPLPARFFAAVLAAIVPLLIAAAVAETWLTP